MRAESRSTPTNPPAAKAPSRSSTSSVNSPVAPINSHQSQRRRERPSSSQSRWAASRRTRRFPSRHSALAGLAKASCRRSESSLISALLVQLVSFVKFHDCLKLAFFPSRQQVKQGRRHHHVARSLALYC